MHFEELARARSMTRAFLPDEVPGTVLTHILDLARRVPSAGNAQGFDFVVLIGSEQTQRYWDTTLPAPRRAGFAWPGLLACPVLVTVWANRSAYTQRYAESDKAATGLADPAAWATPYWLVDASFAAMAMQYAAIDAGLGVLFFGMFDHAEDIKAKLGVPQDREPVGTVAIGWPDPSAISFDSTAASPDPAGASHDPLAAGPDSASSRPGRSAKRPRRPLDNAQNAVVHYANW